MNYKKSNQLEEWIVNAIPDALGPLIMTLISTPKAFTIIDSDANKPELSQKRMYDSEGAHLLQQQAIERILGWIVQNAKKQNTISQAQSQFESICMRMNSFGTQPTPDGQLYCSNRLELDKFMIEAVKRLADPENDRMRARYQKHVAILGENLDKTCQRSQFYGRTYIPSSSGTSKYIGPAR